MAHTPLKSDKMLGWTVTGRLGDLTWYTSSRGKITAYYEHGKHGDASPTQAIIRSRFVQASLAWSALATTERRLWLQAARATSQHCNGACMFWQAWITTDRSIARSAFRQAGLGEPPWPHVL